MSFHYAIKNYCIWPISERTCIVVSSVRTFRFSLLLVDHAFILMRNSQYNGENDRVYECMCVREGRERGREIVCLSVAIGDSLSPTNRVIMYSGGGVITSDMCCFVKGV